MKVHFGHITYDITFVDEPIEVHDSDGGGEAVGVSHHRERRIEVLRDDKTAQEYVANTLLHELLHAACSTVGFHPDNEEETVSALTAGLMLLLHDPRNAGVLAEIVPPSRIVLGAGKIDPEQLRSDLAGHGMWTIPSEQVRSDFAGLAAAAADGAETVAPPREE